MELITLACIPAQSFSAVLGGQNASISLYQRGDHLYMDLWINDVEICRGALCRTGSEIVQSPRPEFKGKLFFYDLIGDEDPNWSELNERYCLIYAHHTEDIINAMEFV